MHSVRADKQNSQLMFSWGLRVLMAIYILITIYTILRMRPCQLWQHFLRVKETIWKWLWLFLSKSLSKKSNHMWVFLSNCPFTWLQREASKTGHREHLNCTRIFRHPQSSGCVQQQCVLLQYGGGKKKKKSLRYENCQDSALWYSLSSETKRLLFFTNSAFEVSQHNMHGTKQAGKAAFTHHKQAPYNAN